jgi:geranylgeranyl reductase family protein
MWDALIIGTGPAGAIAAYELARNNCRTLLIEKEKLPRYKTCGGGLVQKSWEALPFPISDVIEKPIQALRITNNFRHPMLITRESPVVMMTMRSSLDEYLTRKAVEAGAGLYDQVRVEEVVENGTTVECRTSAGTFRGSFLIGADGANSTIAKSLHWPAPQCGVALEVEVFLKDYAAARTDQIDFDFNVIPSGYGWVFPKSDHFSCGVFTLHRTFPEIRKAYEEYIARKHFAPLIRDSRLSGHLIPLKPVSKSLHSKRCVLAGDAAGLADPLTGEGISFAIRSGRLAAQAVIRHNLPDYSRQIQEGMAAEIRLSRFLAKLLYGAPNFMYQTVARKNFFADRILDLFAGKTTYRELAKSVLLKPYKLL